MTVLQEILEWSHDRPAWQRDALHRLVLNGELSEDDIGALSEICKGAYHWQHEPCWYAVRTKGHWTGDRKQTTLWTIASGGQDTVTVHGTQKPVECMRRPMMNNSESGDAVYEPFLGSGTTLIAAESIDRACFASELDSLYVDVAVRRWQAFTGQRATLQADGRTFEAMAAEQVPSADGAIPQAGGAE